MSQAKHCPVQTYPLFLLYPLSVHLPTPLVLFPAPPRVHQATQSHSCHLCIHLPTRLGYLLHSRQPIGLCPQHPQSETLANRQLICVNSRHTRDCSSYSPRDSRRSNNAGDTHPRCLSPCTPHHRNGNSPIKALRSDSR